MNFSHCLVLELCALTLLDLNRKHMCAGVCRRDAHGSVDVCACVRVSLWIRVHMAACMQVCPCVSCLWWVRLHQGTRL